MAMVRRVLVGGAAALVMAVVPSPALSSPTGVRTASVTGTVTSGGQPLAGVKVVADRDGVRSTHTAGDGTYTLTGLLGGATQICFEGLKLGNTGYVTDCQHADIGPGVTTVDATLVPGGAISGRVTDPKGRAIDGAVVSIDGNSARTHPDGIFRVSGIPAGSYAGDCVATLNARGLSPTGYVGSCPAFQSALTVAAGALTAAPDQVLQFGGAISGLVVDAVSGQPVAGAEISADSPGEHEEGAYAVSTADGRYRLNGLAGGVDVSCAAAASTAGSWPLGYLGDSNSMTPCSSSEITVEGRAVSTRNLRLQRAGGAEGSFVTSRGAAIPGVRVLGFGGDPITGADGTYVVGGVATGTYELCEDPSQVVDQPIYGYPMECYFSKGITAGDPATDFGRVPIIDGAEFEGTVTDATTGAPIAGATVKGSLDILATTDSTGHYLVTHVPPGTNYATVVAPGYRAIDNLRTGQLISDQATEFDVGLRRDH